MNGPKRVLVYGFGPYRQFRDNITARILRMIPARAGLKKIVFPVRFQRKQFVAAIVRFKPEVILGLGQSTRRRLETESQARNRRRGRVEAPLKKIAQTGPAIIQTTLHLKQDRLARRSVNAGDYVCNFSMYVMLDHIRRTGADCRYGFLHIPHDYNVEKAGRWVQNILQSCCTQRTIVRRRASRKRKAA